MGYPELLAKTHGLAAAAQTMGVLGAVLRLRQMGQDGHPRVRGALQAVLRNLEPGLLDGLEPGQMAAIVGHLTYALQEALDLIREPERSPGWELHGPGYSPRARSRIARRRAELRQSRATAAGIGGSAE